MSRHRRGLRAIVVHMLSRSPKTGAEIMDEMEEMSRGWWRPSPGSVYPLLEEMAKEGVVKRREDGRYELTDTARSQWGGPFGPWGTRNAADAVRELSGLVAFLEDLRRSKPAELEPLKGSLKDALERLGRLVG